MLKLSLGDLISSAESLHALAREKLPVKLAYQISKTLKNCEKESKHFDELRKNKAAELDIKIGKNNMYDFLPDQRELFQNAIEEMSKIEVEIYGEKFDIEQLGDIKFEAGYLSQLHWMFV